MQDRTFRLQVDPGGTLWVDCRSQDDHAAGDEFVIKQGSDPDSPQSEVFLSGRDLAEILRLVDISDVSEGHKQYK
jgi:hypothetical protein